MLKYVIVNLLPLAHAAFGQNTFLFLSISAADTSCKTGRSSCGLLMQCLFHGMCCEPWQAPGYQPGRCQGSAMLAEPAPSPPAPPFLPPSLPLLLLLALIFACLPLRTLLWDKESWVADCGAVPACTLGVTLACSGPWLLWPVHTEQVPLHFSAA